MIKTKQIFVLTVAAAGLVLASSAAQATPTLSIIWQSTGTATLVSPTASATIVADIVIATNTLTVRGIFISIEFDVSELQAISASELQVVNLPGFGREFRPLASGTSIDNTNGLVENFDQQTLSSGMFGGQTRTLGSVTFHVVGAANSSGDIDVIVSLQNAGIDDLNGPSGSFGGVFVGASVVPEPTSAILAMAGIAGLGYASRRSLR
jgi:hypothetical protein